MRSNKKIVIYQGLKESISQQLLSCLKNKLQIRYFLNLSSDN